MRTNIVIDDNLMNDAMKEISRNAHNKLIQADESGGAFAFFAKGATLLAVCLDEFVMCIS